MPDLGRYRRTPSWISRSLDHRLDVKPARMCSLSLAPCRSIYTFSAARNLPSIDGEKHRPRCQLVCQLIPTTSRPVVSEFINSQLVHTQSMIPTDFVQARSHDVPGVQDLGQSCPRPWRWRSRSKQEARREGGAGFPLLWFSPLSSLLRHRRSVWSRATRAKIDKWRCLHLGSQSATPVPDLSRCLTLCGPCPTVTGLLPFARLR